MVSIIFLIFTIPRAHGFTTVNSTLTQEQINEVEKNPSTILDGCINKIYLKQEAGGLCDAFNNYLLDKCERFENILDYCGLIGLGEYNLKRLIQLSCLRSPPLFNDIERIKSCDVVINLNSSYTNNPPILSVSQLSLKDGNITIVLGVQNAGTSPLRFNGVSYNVFLQGNKLYSGCFGQVPSNLGCIGPSNDLLELSNSELSNYKYTTSDKTTTYDKQALNMTNPHYVINGTFYYYFKNVNTNPIAKNFSTTFP